MDCQRTCKNCGNQSGCSNTNGYSIENGLSIGSVYESENQQSEIITDLINKQVKTSDAKWSMRYVKLFLANSIA